MSKKAFHYFVSHFEELCTENFANTMDVVFIINL